MSILVVGGSHRGVGKTALVCGLIAALPERGWIAVKITSDNHGQTESIWEEKQMGQGTDTGRYLTAGAARAFLIRASDSEMKERLEELEKLLGAEKNLIFESNRVVDFVMPDLCLMVDGGGAEENAKPSFWQIAASADAVVSQAAVDSIEDESDWLNRGFEGARPRFRLIAFERISTQMQEWVRERIPVLCDS